MVIPLPENKYISLPKIKPDLIFKKNFPFKLLSNQPITPPYHPLFSFKELILSTALLIGNPEIAGLGCKALNKLKIVSSLLISPEIEVHKWSILEVLLINGFSLYVISVAHWLKIFII